MPRYKELMVGILGLMIVVLMIGNSLNIEDYESVSYRNHSTVLIGYPDDAGNWTSSSRTNIMVNSDNYLMADQNDYAKWVSESLRINDNRQIVYEADVANPADVGITIQASDYQNFSEIQDIQKSSLQDGFNEIELDMDRSRYTRIILEFDKAADASTAVNRLSIEGIRSDVKTDFTPFLDTAVFLVFFFVALRLMGRAFGWW